MAKLTGRERRKLRIRSKISGTTERPRLSVFRTGRHIYAQVVVDDDGKTLAAASSFAATYALGKAADFYLARRRRGVTAQEVATVYRRSLREAFRLARERNVAGASATEAGARP